MYVQALKHTHYYVTDHLQAEFTVNPRLSKLECIFSRDYVGNIINFGFVMSLRHSLLSTLAATIKVPTLRKIYVLFVLLCILKQSIFFLRCLNFYMIYFYFSFI